MAKVPGAAFYHSVVAILRPVCKFWFGLKVVGRENLVALPKTGVITVSNHVAALDGPIVAGPLAPRRMAFTASPMNFCSPVVGNLVRLLGCIPVPRKGDAADAERFIADVGDRLARGWGVHYYPEGHLIPHCEDLREFRPGAFNAAVKYQVPVLPMRIVWEPAGPVRRLIRRKPRAVLHILPLHHPAGETPEAAMALLAEVREALQALV